MKRVLCIGDLHYKKETALLNDLLSSKLLEFAQQLKPDFIVMMGDSLDKHENIHMISLCRVVNLFKSLANICHVYVLIGNHDRIGPDDYQSEIHPFVGLSNPNLTVVHKVTVVEDFIFVPYLPVGRFRETVDSYVTESTSCIFAHQEFYGCNYGPFKSTKGDVIPNDYPHIISGHIHEYDQLQTNILYIGTPAQVNYNSTELLKTISLFMFNDNGKLENEERFDTSMPYNKSFKIEAREFEDFEIPTVADYIKLKIVVTGTKDEIDLIRKTSKYIKNKSIITLKVIKERVVLEQYIPVQKLSFIERLYQKLNDDKLIELFEEIIN